ncbi:MAG TPA: rhodanese-like domain-containing protein [Gaiellaceae bacterium]|nr:rhodanese-like domain-containing protein [Gaiellaceae bacterium]
MPRTLDDLLDAARAKLERLTPRQALEAAAGGALLVDTRSERDRDRSGVAFGSVHIPLSVLEWRVAPDSEWRNPHLGPPGRKLVLICAHGYSSSLAAARLVDLGLDATDVIGGFDAWSADGLPAVAPSQVQGDGELPGMDGPEPRSR